MNQIGKKIYYEKATGNVLVDTGERSGFVVETTQEQDFAAYADLAARVPDTVGVMVLTYGEYGQDFAACNGFKVDVSVATPALLFSFPDPNAPQTPPVYRNPLSVDIDDLKSRQADILLAMVTNNLM